MRLPYSLPLRVTSLFPRARHSYPPSKIFLSSMSTSTNNSRNENLHPNDVLSFWFEELSFQDWFKTDPELDKTMTDKFGGLLKKASACELGAWRATAEGSLAEIIVLDQFSRNIFRGDPKAFSQDSLALALSQEAIAKTFDKELDSTKLAFLYMPFMHSESKVIHERAMDLFQAPGLEFQLGFEKKHKVIIDRFGRYPHRNEVLCRDSTPEEIAFLKEPDSSF